MLDVKMYFIHGMFHSVFCHFDLPGTSAFAEKSHTNLIVTHKSMWK